VLQVPSVQTGLARFVTGKLESAFNGSVKIGSVQINPFSAITVRDLVLLDEDPYRAAGFEPADTVASIGKLSATVSLKQIFNRRCACLGRVEAEDLNFYLAIEPEGRGTNITRVLNLGSSESKPMKLDSLFTANKLTVRNARFRMVNYNSSYSREHGINFADMDVRFDAKAHSLGFWGGRMHAVVDKFSAREKSGFNVENLSGSCAVGMGETKLLNVKLKDDKGTELDLPRAVLSYTDTSAWGDFINAVNIDVTFAPSRLVLQFISNFSGGTFYGCPFTADIQGGRFNGTVSDFTVNDFNLTTPYGPYGNVDVHMKGLPRINSTELDASINEIHFTSAGLSAALADLGAKINTSRFAPGVPFTLRAVGSGPMNKFKATSVITSSIGSLNASANVLNMVDSSKPISLDANIKANEFDLGKLLSSETFGKTSFTAQASGQLAKNAPGITLKSLDVEKLGLMGYDYSDLHLSGTLLGKALTASLVSDDPNALLNLEGSFNLDDKYGKLNADFKNIDLAALNLDKRGGKSTVSFSLEGDQGIFKNSPAYVQISDLVLANDKGTYNIGDIVAQARLHDDRLTAIINSEVFDAKYNGPTDFGGLVKFARSVTVDRELPEFFKAGDKKEEETDVKGMDATFSALFHDTRELLAYVLPGAGIASGSAVNLDIASDGTVLGYINAQSLNYNNLSVTGMKLALANMDGRLNCSVNSDMLQIGTLSFDKASVKLDADDNLATAKVNYEGADLLESGSELNLEALLLRDSDGRPAIDLNTLQSYLSIKNDVWTLNKSSIKLHGGDIDVAGFRLASERQSIAMNGSISTSHSDTLQVRLRNVDMGIVNDFAGGSIPNIQGIIHGDATLLSPVPSEMGLSGDLMLKGVKIEDKSAGDLELHSLWADSGKALILDLRNYVADNTVLSVNGTYGLKDRKVDAVAKFDCFNAGIGAPFLKNILTELDGNISGEVRATGQVDKLSLQSDDLTVAKLRTRVSYTNVAYTLDGRMKLDDQGLKFDNIMVTDDYGGSGSLGGGIQFKYLKDFYMDASMRMRRLKAIDIHDANSPIMVYGDLALSGRSTIRGPFNALSVDADVSTSGEGNVSVPLPSSATAKGGSSLLTFKQEESDEDDGNGTTGGRAKKSSSRFSTHARVNISPEVMASVEIDKESGHVLTAGGSGIVTLDLNTAKGDLQLKGDYNIEKGKYLFNIPGVVSKEFDIKSGSSLQFNGPVRESTMDVHAIHNVKTSLSTLVADSTAVSSRRNVECGINISGKLSNPDVSFSINVPDLDPSTNMQVENALSTQDKIQKQFVALLLFGTFLPEEGSGVVNGTNMIASNVGEIVSSQLNNILQKLDIPLDFGLGYQHDNVGTDIFDVAVSTQLFNNRVLVNGSVGNRKYSTSKNSYGDVVGDLDIEIKIDRNGELRFKVFSHSADEFSSSLDFSQRNGLGFTYQKEFDHTLTFLKQLFMSREEKTRQTLTEAAMRREMSTITIE